MSDLSYSSMDQLDAICGNFVECECPHGDVAEPAHDSSCPAKDKPTDGVPDLLEEETTDQYMTLIISQAEQEKQDYATALFQLQKSYSELNNRYQKLLATLRALRVTLETAEGV